MYFWCQVFPRIASNCFKIAILFMPSITIFVHISHVFWMSGVSSPLPIVSKVHLWAVQRRRTSKEITRLVWKDPHTLLTVKGKVAWYGIIKITYLMVANTAPWTPCRYRLFGLYLEFLTFVLHSLGTGLSAARHFAVNVDDFFSFFFQNPAEILMCLHEPACCKL